MNPGTAISFNGNSLQTSNIIVSDIDHYSDSTKAAKLYPLAHANASVIPFVEYPSKVIMVTGKMTDTSIAALDADIRTFKSWFAGLANANQHLDIAYDGTTVQYIATGTVKSIKRPLGLLVANFNLQFDCTIPFGSDTTSTNPVNSSGITTGNNTYNITFNGTAPQQLPIVTITLTAVSDSSGGYIFIGNSNTGQGITVQRTWNNGDVLVIDPTQLNVIGGNPVTVNSSPVAFSGAFPEFAPGAQTLAYQDNFTSRTYNINVVYTALYE